MARAERIRALSQLTIASISAAAFVVRLSLPELIVRVLDETAHLLLTALDRVDFLQQAAAKHSHQNVSTSYTMLHYMNA